MSRRDSGVEQQIDSRKYTERVRGLINESIDAIAATDNERRDVLQRWRLPEALGVGRLKDSRVCSQLSMCWSTCAPGPIVY